MANQNLKRPNIVFILSDDQGYWAMGCSGNSEIRTPNLDELARRGVRFENFFCTSPVCSPARASLLTGRIPSQHGVHDWLRDGNYNAENLRTIEYLEGQTGYTDVLAENGYICGISGKWHLGDSLKPQKSFSHWYVHPKGGSQYIDAPMIRNGKLFSEPGYLTDRITDDALDFLDNQSGGTRPFYLSVHYTAPHSPWVDQHPRDIVDSYDDCLFESCPQETRHPDADFIVVNYSEMYASKERKKRGPISIREHLKGYFASITAMDENIGRIIDKLKSLKLMDNTLVVFMGDNGFNCGHHGIWGKGNATFPLNLYDTSVKVPAIMSHPQIIPQGKVCESLLSGYDFFPTLLDYLDMNNPEAGKLPGRSFLSLLQGKREDIHDHIVVYDEYGPNRMIRTREWKYIHRYPYGHHELYDLVNDPLERINLITDERVISQKFDKADIIRSLRAEMERWFDRYSDPPLDGRHQAVTGRGQIDRVGQAGKGTPSFHGLETAEQRVKDRIS